jgi:hypothetical protein
VRLDVVHHRTVRRGVLSDQQGSATLAGVEVSLKDCSPVLLCLAGGGLVACWTSAFLLATTRHV